MAARITPRDQRVMPRPQLPHVVPGVALEVRVAQQRRRVAGGRDGDPSAEVHRRAQALEAGVGARQGLGGDAP